MQDGSHNAGARPPPSRTKAGGAAAWGHGVSPRKSLCDQLARSLHQLDSGLVRRAKWVSATGRIAALAPAGMFAGGDSGPNSQPEKLRRGV